MTHVTFFYGGNLWYRSFESKNEYEMKDFILLLKLYNSLHCCFKNIKIRKSLYSSKYGFFDKMFDDYKIETIVSDTKYYYSVDVVDSETNV